MELTAQQNKVFEQIKDFMNSDASVFILQGYAGTGKTTMVKVIADEISQTRRVVLMAPTGRAARVLQQKTGHEAMTIHRAIYENVGIEQKKVKDIAETEFKLLFPIRQPDAEKIVAIVDEASMVCSRNTEQEIFVFGSGNVMKDLLTFVRIHQGGKIIFVGDPAQLPPVGEPTSNALRAEYFKTLGIKAVETELTEVLRQKEESMILKNAMTIRDLLKTEKRNNLVFRESAGDVERIHARQLIEKYLEHRRNNDKNDSVVICYSNMTANRYNKEIRTALYGADAPIRVNDILLIVHNNYKLNRMNGEFVPVLSIGSRIQQSAPIYVQDGDKKKKVVITMNFIQVEVLDGYGNPTLCMLYEDLLTSDKATISVDENRALFINFCMRHPGLKQGTIEFAHALKDDPYYNAIRAKYGYAVTGHKCQGGEWNKVFVDYTGRTGLSDDCLRWAYTATTRAHKTLYIANYPDITPFSRFRIDSIQKCKKINPECRILYNTPATPYHDTTVENGIRAKYHCIEKNLENTPYQIKEVKSSHYREEYTIQTPNGTSRYDICYKEGALFLPATANNPDQHTPNIKLLLDDERCMEVNFNYTPSKTIYHELYNLMRSVCDTLSVQITNVVEHDEDYSIVFYMRTCNTFSYIKIYVNGQGFVTYAKPMSLKGTEDNELDAIIKTLNFRFK